MRTLSLAQILVTLSAATSAVGTISGCGGSDDDPFNGGGTGGAPGSSGFSTPQKVSDNTQADGDSLVAIDVKGTVHIAWITTDSGDVQHLAYANNSSGAWAVEQISSGSATVSSFDFGVDTGGAAHLIWCEDTAQDTISYRNNRGGSLGAIETMSTGAGEAWDPSIKVGPDGMVHAAWSEETGFGIFYNKLSGSTWESATRLDSNVWGPDKKPIVAVGSDGEPQVCWENDADPYTAGWNLVWSKDKGQGWEHEWVLDQTVDNVIHDYDCAADMSGNIHIAVARSLAGEKADIFYITNLSGSIERTNLSNAASTNDLFVDIEVDGAGQVHLVWVNNSVEIHYTDNTSGSFAAPTKISTAESRTTLEPRLVVEATGTAHVVWWERIAEHLGSWTGFQANYWAAYWSNAAGVETAPLYFGQEGYSLSPAISLTTTNQAHLSFTTYLQNTAADSEIFYSTRVASQ